MRVRPAVTLVLGVAVVLPATRAIVYGLAPSQTVVEEQLRHRAGGPAFAGVVLAAAGVIVALAASALWLATMAVQERVALERRRVVPPPPVQLTAVAVRATVLFVVASLSFVLLESYEHWRSGLGWHGLHCLGGPIHRDALPVLAALSLLAAALQSALAHLLAWARRTAVALAGAVPLLSAGGSVTSVADASPPLSAPTVARPRGPPLLLVSVPS